MVASKAVMICVYLYALKTKRLEAAMMEFSAAATGRGDQLSLLYYEFVSHPSLARARLKQLQALSQQKKLWLIRRTNRDFRDLSRQVLAFFEAYGRSQEAPQSQTPMALSGTD